MASLGGPQHRSRHRCRVRAREGGDKSRQMDRAMRDQQKYLRNRRLAGAVLGRLPGRISTHMGTLIVVSLSDSNFQRRPVTFDVRTKYLMNKFWCGAGFLLS